MKTGRSFRHLLVVIAFMFLCAVLYAQDNQTLALKTNKEGKENEVKIQKVKRFSNSESPGISFNISTNLKDCKVQITTNYASPYKVRFVDYWGKSVKVYKNLDSDTQLDLSEFKEQIVIMNIQDNRSNKLLTSKVVNLKRRNYH